MSEFTAIDFGPGINLLSLNKDELIDWFVVIVHLQRSGYSLSSISQQIGTPATTLKGWKYGARPKFEDALPLIDLWSQSTEMPAELLPKIKTP